MRHSSTILVGVVFAAALAAGTPIRADAGPYTYGGHEYWVLTSCQGWQSAESAAVARGGHLVTIDDAAENAFVTSILPGTGGWWTGLSDQAAEGSWVWVGDGPAAFLNWNTPNEPNGGTNENCIEMLKSPGNPWDGRWNDLPCDRCIGAVVEIVPGSLGGVTAGLALWLRADAGVVLESGVVSTWHDLSGHDRDATQGSAALRPLYVTANPSVAGRPTLRFSRHELRFDGSFIGGSDYTVFVVNARNRYDPANFYLAGSTAGVNANLVLGYERPDLCRQAHYGNDLDAVVEPYLGAPIWALDVFRFDHREGRAIYRWGSCAAYDRNSIPVSSWAGAAIGHFMAIPYYWFGGDVAEIVIYSRALSSSERVLVESALASKYGLRHQSLECPGVAPTSSAGPDQTVDENALVTLHGSGSDPLGRPVTYAWTKLAGPEVGLSDPTIAAPTFTAPPVPAGGATLTFQLVVSSAGGSSEPDIVNVTVRNVNHAPIAETTGDRTVPELSPVTLDGRPSYDVDNEPLAFAWTQTAGTLVTLSDAAVPMPTFTAPTVGSAGETLAFRLVVNDGIEESTPATLSVHVTNVNQAPAAAAGADFTSGENAAVALNGSGGDPDLDPLIFAWTQVGGNPVVLSDPTSPSPTFWAPYVALGGETFTFRLVVNDGLLDSPPDEVIVHVLNTNDPPSCAVATASPASLWPPNHAMVPVGVRGVVDPQGDAITIAVTGVMQDEPVSGLGDGDTSPDAVIQGDAVLIRAERSGTGDGRVYTVGFTATDDFGESCSGSVKVAVPHSMKKGVVPVDGGPIYASTEP